MNLFARMGCRIYQGAFRLVTPLLPWREPELLQGEGSVDRLPQLIKSKGVTKVLIVTDKGLVGTGLVAKLTESFDKGGIKYCLFDETVANPTINNIESALKLYKSESCNGIVAIGGGSPMDCAKGVGARVVKPNKQIPKMKGLLKVGKELPTMFAIPTTSGTGSETTIAAVITNSDTHEKYALNDPHLIPRYAVLDPMLTVGLPKHITSTTGIDALTHAVEAYIGHSTTKNTRKMSEMAVKLIFENLKKAYDDGQDRVARSNMQLASYYAGVAFTRSYVGYVHAIAHTLGGFYNLPHGLANAIILPYLLDYYGDTATRPLARLADIIGIKGDSEKEKANKFIQAIKELNASMDIPKVVACIEEKDIPLMSQRANSEGNPLYPVPKEMNRRELAKMYYTIQGKEPPKEL